MDDHLTGVLSNIGMISFIALSAYLLLIVGEIFFGQQAFFAVSAYAAGIATAMWGWGFLPGLVALLERAGLAVRRDILAGGMTPAETERMVALIREAATPGRTCIVIEHKMEMIRELCDRVCVLDFGRKIAEGTPASVLRDEAVIEAYIGREANA